MQVAFGLEVVASCPSGCMDQAVGMGTVVAHLGDSCLARTCLCYYTQAELEEQPADIGPTACQLRIGLVLLNEPVPCVPELGQLVLVVCSELQLAVAVACQELVTD